MVRFLTTDLQNDCFSGQNYPIISSILAPPPNKPQLAAKKFNFLLKWYCRYLLVKFSDGFQRFPGSGGQKGVRETLLNPKFLIQGKNLEIYCKIRRLVYILTLFCLLNRIKQVSDHSDKHFLVKNPSDNHYGSP